MAVEWRKMAICDVVCWVKMVSVPLIGKFTLRFSGMLAPTRVRVTVWVTLASRRIHMKALNFTRTFAGALASIAIVATAGSAAAQPIPASEKKPMDLGNFSVSLNVKDIKASMAFYEKLDFKVVAGKLEQKWIVLQSGNARIGLFQGMFDKNIMTFNPGWTKDKETMKEFQDVREIQRTLKARGITTVAPEADEKTEGPAYFKVTDPDGNMLLFDQHVPSPKR